VRQSTELLVAVVFRLLRSFLGPAWVPARVCFAHEAPRDRRLHDKFFGCRVEFGHAFNGMVIARAELDTPNPDPDPGLALMAETLLGTAQPLNAPFTRTVREIIVLLLGQGACTVERAAAHLGVDRRTIHRRLERERQTFSNLVDDTRFELAERDLASPSHSLSEIAGLLGFAAPSGFSRWYRQRAGRAPSQSRDAARGRSTA
jgi:AraC-like DNA-binding protein